jgi:hypothetical protein
MSPRGRSLAAKTDGETGVRLPVKDVGGRDNLVAKGERSGVLRRGVKCGMATGETTGAVDGCGVVTTFEGGAPGASLDISHSKSGDNSSLKGIRVELGPGVAKAGGGRPTWVEFSAIEVKDGTTEGGLVDRAIFLEVPAA